MDLQRNLRLAKYLGCVQTIKCFDESGKMYEERKCISCDVSYRLDGAHYYWYGLEIPESAVDGIVTYDPCRSGRYPRYLQLFKEKDKEGCRKHLLRNLRDVPKDRINMYMDNIERFLNE